MNNEMVETVLHEVLNEQKEMSKSNKQLINKVEFLSEQLKNIEKEIRMHQIVPEPSDIIAQPNNVIHQKHIIIFPEFKSPECYRLLFNCIIYMTIATYSFLIIKVIVDYWCG
jgi:hypothetical protein